MSVPKFPSLFFLYGSNTNLGHNSIIEMIECHTGYIAEALRESSARKHGPWDERGDVFAKFNDELQQNLKTSVWPLRCFSGYKTADGRVTHNWRGSVEDYRQATAKFDLSVYELLDTPASAAA